MTQEESSTPQQDRLSAFVRSEYRSLVVRRLKVTAEWRILEWLQDAACKTTGTATEETCRSCRVWAECLGAALATDDPAEWRGALNRRDRQRLWVTIERTYREVRDLELDQLDYDALERLRKLRSTRPEDAPPVNGQPLVRHEP